MGLLAIAGITAAAAQPYAYVANLGNNTVSVVNMANYTTIGSVTVPSGPAGAAVTPDGSTVYISSTNANVVSAISAASRTVIASIAVGSNPKQLAISPNGAQVYVIDAVSNMVSVIATASNTVTASIPVGSRPSSVAFSPDGTRAYVTNLWANNVSVIDTSANAVVNTFVTGGAPNGVAVSPSGNRIYVTNQSSNALTVHDNSGNIVTTITGFQTPIGLAINPSGTRVFVVNANGNSVSVIDTGSNSVIAKTTVGSLPASVAISTDGTRAYVANEYGYSLSILDTSSFAVVNTIANIGIWPAVVATQPPPAAGGTCTFQVNPGTLSFPASGGSTTIGVTASSSSCSWGVSGPNWVGLNQSATSGNGTVTVTAGANNSSQPLSGTITVAGQQFTVTQAGVSCTYNVTLTSGSLAFGASGGSATLSVTTQSPCTWSATGPNWVSLTQSTTTGNGTVGISASANNSTSGLSGTISVGGQQFTVTEAGIVCTYTVSLTSGSLGFGANGGSATLSVTTQSPCTWAATGPNWVSLTQSTTSGSGTVGVTAGPNGTINGLSGSITVAGQAFPTTESGIACTYSLNGSGSLLSSSGTGSVTVTSPAGCPWTATDTVDTWITITGGATGSGTGTVSYSYNANNSTGTRQGTLTIANQSFGLTQAAFVFSPIFVNAGGAAFTDLNGNQWQADNGPGRSYSVSSSTITDPQGKFTQIYQKSAYAGGAGLTYTFSVPNGGRTVTLYFAETYEMASGRRVMNISINGQQVDSLDVFSLSGGMNTAFAKAYTATVTNGQITITLAPSTTGATAMLSGLEIQ